MNPFVILAALVTTAGAIVATTDRDARYAGIGLSIAVIGSAFVLAPPPTMTAMAFRVVAGVLAAFLVRISIRQVTHPIPSPLGFRAPTLAAVAAFSAGLGVTPLVVQRSGPEAAVAAGLALLILAAPLVVVVRDPFRLGTGILIAACGALMIRAALGGSPSAFEEVAEGALMIAMAAAIAVAVSVAHGVEAPVDDAEDAAGARGRIARAAAQPDSMLGLARRAARPVLGARRDR